MNVEETPRFGSKKGRKLTSLTNIQKKELCKYKKNNQPGHMKKLVGNSALANQLQETLLKKKRNGLPLPKAQ